MTLADHIDPLMKLLYDARWSEAQLTKEDNQFTRRAYIRAVFAYIEGATWLLKQTCLKAPSTTGPRRIEPATYALLSDQTYDLKNNGEAKIQTKFLRLPDNVRFAFRTFDSCFRTQTELGVGSGSWDSFLAAIEIRNRITHPKDTADFDVTDSELALSKSVCSWFNDLTHACVKAMIPPTDTNATNA